MAVSIRAYDPKSSIKLLYICVIALVVAGGITWVFLQILIGIFSLFGAALTSIPFNES